MLTCMICFHLMLQIFEGRQISDLQDLAHAAGWEPHNLHGLAHTSWVGYVLCRPCTPSHKGGVGSVDDLYNLFPLQFMIQILQGRYSMFLICMICLICMIYMIQIMLPGGSRTICTIQHMYPGLDMYYADPAHHLMTTGQDLDDMYDLFSLQFMIQILQGRYSTFLICMICMICMIQLMLPGGSRVTCCMIQDICTRQMLHNISQSAGGGLDDLLIDHDLSDLCIVGANNVTQLLALKIGPLIDHPLPYNVWML